MLEVLVRRLSLVRLHAVAAVALALAASACTGDIIDPDGDPLASAIHVRAQRRADALHNSNWMYVMGNGLLKTGWFGGVKADGTVKGFDPATGAENDAPSNSLAGPASAAVAYAIAKGDMRRVGDFARGVTINALVKPITM